MNQLYFLCNNFYRLAKVCVAGFECYHASKSDFEIGETYTFNPEIKRINPLNHKISMVLEKARKNKFPNKPSRLTSFFCSPFKKSQWVGSDSKIYRVEASENYHIGNIKMLAEMFGARFDEKLMKFFANVYWKGSLPGMSTNEDVEILTPTIKIISRETNNLKQLIFFLKKNMITTSFLNEEIIIPSGTKIIMIPNVELSFNKSNTETYKYKPNIFYKCVADKFSIDEKLNKLLVIDAMSKKFELLEPT